MIAHGGTVRQNKSALFCYPFNSNSPCLLSPRLHSAPRLDATTSLPFTPPAKGKVAVKVINHYGDEVLKVFRVP
jgi:hypothetical protein